MSTHEDILKAQAVQKLREIHRRIDSESPYEPIGKISRSRIKFLNRLNRKVEGRSGRVSRRLRRLRR